MAQAHPLHYRQRLNDHHNQPFQQPQLGPVTFRKASIPLEQTQDFRQSCSMAQPSLQYRADSHSYAMQQWQRQQLLPQEHRSSMNAQLGFNSSDTSYSQDGVWGRAAMFDPSFVQSNGVKMEPYMVTEFNPTLYSNNGFMYPNAAPQGFSGKGSIQYSGGLSWPIENPCGTSANGSEQGKDNSLSPKSYTSELLDSEAQPFTPATTVDTSSESSKWAQYAALSYPASKMASPEDMSRMVRDVPAAGYSGFRHTGLGIAMPSPTSAVASRQPNGLPSPCKESNRYSSDYPISQQSSPGVSTWDLLDHSNHQTATAFRSQVPQAISTPPVATFNQYQARSNSDRSYEVAAWNGAQAHVPAQIHLQNRFQAARSVDPQAQRKADDDILLQGKMDGLTYKEIRKKMHAKPAESTLRGRYRSLTKARKDRVRKPVWQSLDLELLKEYVQQELDRIDTNHHHPLGYAQRLGKVQWKKVADYILTHGGSYHFGNSTCKRKWTELNPCS